MAFSDRNITNELRGYGDSRWHFVVVEVLASRLDCSKKLMLD
jgi:hypothetical protein